MFENLSTFDLSVIAIYFIAVFALAFGIIIKEKISRKKGGRDSAGYFLGGRNLGWFVIGASLFASNIGSEHLVGLAGAGASGDFAAGQFEILAGIILLVLGWFFVPFYLKSGVFTMPQFLEHRFSKWARGYLSWVSILAYIITKISVTIAAGGIVFTTLLGIDFWTGAIIIVVATGIYTVFGGLKAVIYTDMMQMFVLIGGAIAVTVFGIIELGGWGEITARTDDMYLSLWRPLSDPDFPWTGILFGAPILGVWYWCTDQFIVQRVLAARNIDQARKGTIFAGYLKMLPLFIFVLPGVVAFALSTGDNPAITFPMEDGAPVYDAALPVLILQLLPSGLKGLVIAGMLAALMSSLSSVFNSCSTLFTIDIYKKYYPESSERKLVVVGQIATAVLVVLGLAWIPLLKIIEGGLFQKLQSIQAYISPPIAAVFLLGIFSARLNAHGAKAALISGGLLGALRLVLELFKDQLGDGLIFAFADINFLHFAFFLFVVCSVILIVVSLVRPVAITDEARRLTYGKDFLTAIKGTRSASLLTWGVLIITALIWFFFA